MKVEIGQNIRTSFAQAVADELRLPVGAITLVLLVVLLDQPIDASSSRR